MKGKLCLLVLVGVAVVHCTKSSKPDEPVKPSESPYRILELPAPYMAAWVSAMNPHLSPSRVWAYMLAINPSTRLVDSFWIASSAWNSPGWTIHANITSVENQSHGAGFHTIPLCVLANDEVLHPADNALIRVSTSGGYSVIRQWPDRNGALVYGCSPSGLITWLNVSLPADEIWLMWSSDHGQTWDSIFVSDQVSYEGAGRIHPEDETFWFAYGTMVMDGTPARILRFHADTRTLDTIWMSHPEDSLFVLDLIPAPASPAVYGIVYKAVSGIPGTGVSRAAWVWKIHPDGRIDTLVTLPPAFLTNCEAVLLNNGDLYLFPTRHPQGDPQNLDVPLIAYRLSPDGSFREVEFPPVPEELLPPRSDPQWFVYRYGVMADPAGEHWMFVFSAIQDNALAQIVTLQFDGRPTVP